MTKIRKLQTDVENEKTDLREKKLFVLAEYLEQLADCRRMKRKIRKSRRGPSWKNQPNLFTFPYQTN